VLAVIAGPTAVGKTTVSIRLAQKLDAEIISADSAQVYRYMDIGTAKPSMKERAGVKHHLIDVVDPAEEFTVADYQQLAEDAIQSIKARGKLPLMVGGTGLYIKAVIDGFLFPDEGADWQLREELLHQAREHGNQYLHDKLRRVDPPAAGRIHPNDVKRVIRALEVYRRTGKPITWHQQKAAQMPPRYDAVMIGLKMGRSRLYARINDRVDRMLKQGLIDEVCTLLNRGYDDSLISMQALGYKEIIGYLQGKYDLEKAIRLLKRDTRRFAKRQLTWFCRDKRIHWLDWDDYPCTELMVEKIISILSID